MNEIEKHSFNNTFYISFMIAMTTANFCGFRKLTIINPNQCNFPGLQVKYWLNLKKKTLHVLGKKTGSQPGIAILQNVTKYVT